MLFHLPRNCGKVSTCGMDKEEKDDEIVDSGEETTYQEHTTHGLHSS